MGDFNTTLPGAFGVERLKASELEILRQAIDALTSAWSTWSPTNGAITVGSGTVTARYRRLGKTVDYLWKFLLGSGSAVGTGPNFTLPFTPHSAYTTAFTHLGWGTLIDAGTAHYPCVARLNSGSTVEVTSFDGSVAVVRQAGVTSTAPFTWTSGDAIIVKGQYETA